MLARLLFLLLLRYFDFEQTSIITTKATTALLNSIPTFTHPSVRMLVSNAIRKRVRVIWFSTYDLAGRRIGRVSDQFPLDTWVM